MDRSRRDAVILALGLVVAAYGLVELVRDARPVSEAVGGIVTGAGGAVVALSGRTTARRLDLLGYLLVLAGILMMGGWFRIPLG
jgi:hypothetical protein